MPDQSRAGWPGRVAVAIVNSEPPQVLLATDASEERWADAVVEWIQATGDAIDAYPDADVWSESRLDAEVAALEIRLARIFDGSGGHE